MTFAGDFINNGTVTNSTGTQIYTFTGLGKSITGSSASTFETFNINSGAAITAYSPCTIASTFTGTVAGTLAMSAALTNSGTLNVTGMFQLNQAGSLTGNAAVYTSTSTLKYEGTTQIPTAIEWPSSNSPANLIIANSVSVTIPGAFARTLTGDLTLQSGTLSDGSNTLTVQGNILGTATHSGLGKILMTGASKTISGATLGNLELDNASDFSLSDDAIITNLVFTNGKLLLGGNDLSTTTITGFSMSKYIVTDGLGRLTMTAPNSGLTTFPIGATTSSYDPVAVTPSTRSGCPLTSTFNVMPSQRLVWNPGK